MDETNAMFHSYRGEETIDQPELTCTAKRELVSKIASQYGGHLFSDTYNEDILEYASTYQFPNSISNYLFRYDLIKNKIAYNTTGYDISTALEFSNK